MKRIMMVGAIVVSAAFAGSIAMYGPELWAGYRFMQAVDQHDGGPLALLLEIQ